MHSLIRIMRIACIVQRTLCAMVGSLVILNGVAEYAKKRGKNEYFD